MFASLVAAVASVKHFEFGSLPLRLPGREGAATRCNQTELFISCPYLQTQLSTGRWLYYQTPLGTPPAKGWPVAVLFQGSFFQPATFWTAVAGEPFGGYTQVEVVKALLDAGFAVLTPFAIADICWETNIPPYDLEWRGCDDDATVRALFAAISAGTLGPLDVAHVHASGISSGGYMSSRAAISYWSRFRSVAVASGSYMICGGPACVVPLEWDCCLDPAGGGPDVDCRELPFHHPPTLFMHGLLDPIVPYYTMEQYHLMLIEGGIDTQVVTCDTCDHQWVPSAPQAVVAWFVAHADWAYTGPHACTSAKP